MLQLYMAPVAFRHEVQWHIDAGRGSFDRATLLVKVCALQRH
jgi:hypothetical protein